ncbi:MAG: hypothetical protein HQL50_04275 [Magnetococcales bacterium]|nr:hypothetical protein [Magnetococcales bacterium]
MKRSITGVGVGLGLMVLMAGLSGCNSLLNQPNMTPGQPPALHNPAASTLPMHPQAHREVDIVEVSRRIADSLVAELLKNHPSFQRRKPILVTSFVDLNNLDSSSKLGLLMAEQISARMTQQRFTVVESRMRNNLAIRSRQGEFILSRDTEKIAAENKAYAVIVGNYSYSQGLLYTTSKIIQIRNRHSLASVSAKVPVTSPTLRDLLVETSDGTPVTVVNQ